MLFSLFMRNARSGTRGRCALIERARDVVPLFSLAGNRADARHATLPFSVGLAIVESGVFNAMVLAQSADRGDLRQDRRARDLRVHAEGDGKFFSFSASDYRCTKI